MHWSVIPPAPPSADRRPCGPERIGFGALLFLESIVKKKKETRGRKKLPKDQQRVLLSARVAPDVMQRLLEINACGGGYMSLGQTIDALVRMADKVH